MRLARSPRDGGLLRLTHGAESAGYSSGNAGHSDSDGERVAGAVAVEPIQGVVVVVDADAAGDGQLGRNVERGLAEHRLVAVDAVLVGQPDRVGPARAPRSAGPKPWIT